MELWSYFRFLMPELLGEEEAFRGDNAAADFDAAICRRSSGKSALSCCAAARDVARDLPEKIEQIVW